METTTSTTTVWRTLSQIRLTETSGTVSPENAYTTSIDIWLDPFGRGYQAKLSRTGGTNIVSGAASQSLGYPPGINSLTQAISSADASVEELDLEQALIPVFDSSRTPHALSTSSIIAHSATLVMSQFGSGSWYEFGASYWKTFFPELKTEIVKNPPVYHEDRIGMDMLYYGIQNLEPDTEYAFQALYDDSTVVTFRTLAAD